MRGSFFLFLAALSAFAPSPSRALPPRIVHQTEADFLVTAAPVYVPLAEMHGRERFPRGARLLLVHNGKAAPLVTGFADTADPDLSFGGQRVLFAGKRTTADPWQIWELNLKNGSLRNVISTGVDAERPLYLPGGRIVWAQRTASGFRIESAPDGHPPKVPFLNPTAGPGVLPLTYIQTNAFPTTILADGRILFESGYPLGEGAATDLFAVYADGSGVEELRPYQGRSRWGGSQLASGDVVFSHGRSLARLTSALLQEEPIAAPQAAYAGTIEETPSSEWLLSARATGQTHYAIDLWKPGTAALQTILSERGEDLVQPVLLAPRTPPRRFPSDLHPWNYANLLALDSRLSMEGNLKLAPASVRLESQDPNGHIHNNGTAPIYPDGSFFVKVPENLPIRFLLLDKNGAVLRRERGWFWSRGGEQRICVGCHTGPALSPENQVPEVLLHTTTPMDLTLDSPRTPTRTEVQKGNTR